MLKKFYSLRDNGKSGNNLSHNYSTVDNYKDFNAFLGDTLL